MHTHFHSYLLIRDLSRSFILDDDELIFNLLSPIVI